MPEKSKKTLKYNHNEKSIKIPFIIYANNEYLLEKIENCHSNPEKLSKTKINKNIVSGYSLFMHFSFDAARNKHDYYSGKDCMKIFSKGACNKATK